MELFAEIIHEYEINSSTYEFYKFISDVIIGEPWFEVENKHITGLTFNFFNWRYIKENLDVVDSISNLKYKDLFFITIRKYSSNSDFILAIPESIGLLTSLKHLDLSRNNIRILPDSMSSLRSLKWLDLSRNTILSVSPSLNDFFKSLDSFKI